MNQDRSLAVALRGVRWPLPSALPCWQPLSATLRPSLTAAEIHRPDRPAGTQLDRVCLISGLSLADWNRSILLRLQPVFNRGQRLLAGRAMMLLRQCRSFRFIAIGKRIPRNASTPATSPCGVRSLEDVRARPDANL
jgi:hypothetical protein